MANFSIANEAPGKSAEGAWIKSTEGARGFSGEPWIFIEHTRFISPAVPSLDDAQQFVLWEHGDKGSIYGTQGGIGDWPDSDTYVNLLDGGSLYFKIEGALFETAFANLSPFQRNLCNTSVETPDGFTRTNWRSISGGPVSIVEIDAAEIRKISDDSLVLRINADEKNLLVSCEFKFTDGPAVDTESYGFKGSAQ